MRTSKAVRDKRAPKPPPSEPDAPLEVLEGQPPYAEIAVTSNFSFLRGASTPGEMMLSATLKGYAAIGIADRNTLAGVVRAYAAFGDPRLTGKKPKLLIGARLVFADGTPDILAYPTDRAAYGRLCQLLSHGKLRAPAGEVWDRVASLQGVNHELAPWLRMTAPQGAQEETRHRQAFLIGTLIAAGAIDYDVAHPALVAAAKEMPAYGKPWRNLEAKVAASLERGMREGGDDGDE